MVIDYTIYYKKKYFKIDEFSSDNKWDLYISAYNDSDRVRKVFASANSAEKHWLILPDYAYSNLEYPTNGKVYSFSNDFNESQLIIDYFEKGFKSYSEGKICIDITGFMRPHLIYFIRYLVEKKIKKFDVVYTDPNKYAEGDKTKFTQDSVKIVKQISGCEGEHNSDISNDILIIGAGYDSKLITHVANHKTNAKKVQLFGFPSLKPDMFQENLVNAFKAEEAIGGNRFLDLNSSLFAPANDPFVTAKVIQEFVDNENKKRRITNLYLSPLSTKAQTLGFALYYVSECLKKSVSIIFPYCTTYTRETSKGVDKIWKYSIELNG